MDKVLQRRMPFRTRRYLVDFIGSAYPSYIVSTLLGIAAALIIWSMLLHKQAAQPIQQTDTYTPQPDSVALAQHIAIAHLFGQAVSAEAAVVPVTANISIDGVVYSDDQKSALAVLKVDDKSDIYKIGDTLPDGEKLLAIAPTAVQLGGKGAPRVIELQEDFGDGGSWMQLAGVPGRPDPFPGMHNDAGQPGYASALRPVVLSSESDTLSQLRSLRQQLIPQQPAATSKQAVKPPAKAHQP